MSVLSFSRRAFALARLSCGRLFDRRGVSGVEFEGNVRVGSQKLGIGVIRSAKLFTLVGKHVKVTVEEILPEEEARA